MARKAPKYAESKYKYVKIEYHNDHTYYVRSAMCGYGMKRYKTEKEAALSVDKLLIEKGKEPVNILVHIVMQRRFKVGDKVEIIGNIPFQLKDKPKPLLGTITNIDGGYILIRPKFQRYECEFYSVELNYVA